MIRRLLIVAVPLLLAAPLPGCHLIFPYQDRPAPDSAAKDGPGDNNPDLGDKDGDGGKGKDKGKHKEAGIKLDNGSCPPRSRPTPSGAALATGDLPWPRASSSLR